MNNLDDIYKRIILENSDFEERVTRGDLFIPHEIVLDRRITPTEMFYLASYYCNHKDMKKTDESFDLTNTQLARVKKDLAKYGYLKKTMMTPEQIKEETIKLSHKGKKCEWCGKESHLLHQHHYPIPLKDGGTEIVNICPNCHYTFHKLEVDNYE